MILATGVCSLCASACASDVAATRVAHDGGTTQQLIVPSTWVMYRPYVLGLCFLLLETALVAVLLLERRKTKRAKSLLERRFTIETLISEQSTLLSECSADQIDAEIKRGLNSILDAENADRASWFVIDESGATVRDTYAAQRSGVDDKTEFYCRSEMPWTTKTLLRGSPVVVSDLSEFPQEGHSDRQYLERAGVKSAAFIPSSPGNAAQGVLVIVCLVEHREWPKTLIDRLGVLGNIFSNALMRKRAQNALHESELRFQYVVKEAPIGIALEDMSGKILFANPALCDMLGYGTSEMRGMNCSEFAAGSDEEEDWDHFQEMAAGIIPSYQIEKRYTRKDGRKIWGRLNVSMLRHDGIEPMVLATVEDITEKKAATEDLKRTHGELQLLTSRLFQTQEDERRRIARELHDDVGQRLSLLMMELDAMKNQVPIERTEDHKKLHDLLGQMDELITDIHNMSHRLHSSKLQHLGLRVALKEVCRQVSNAHHVQIDLSADFLPVPLPEQVSLCFYRVAQEAVNNAIKHSGSPRVEVQLTSDDSMLKMRIKDFGVGFDPAERGKGLGLVAMQERLRMIGGNLRIESSDHEGTELLAEVSLEGLPASTKSA